MEGNLVTAVAQAGGETDQDEEDEEDRDDHPKHFCRRVDHLHHHDHGEWL